MWQDVVDWCHKAEIRIQERDINSGRYIDYLKLAYTEDEHLIVIECYARALERLYRVKGEMVSVLLSQLHEAHVTIATVRAQLRRLAESSPRVRTRP